MYLTFDKLEYDEGFIENNCMPYSKTEQTITISFQ